MASLVSRQLAANGLSTAKLETRGLALKQWPPTDYPLRYAFTALVNEKGVHLAAPVLAA